MTTYLFCLVAAYEEMGFNNNERRPKASSDAENYAKGNLKTSTEVWSHAEAKGGGGG